MHRLKTKKIKIGNVVIGGGEQIAVQSMLKTPLHNLKQSIAQIKRLEKVNCQILRVAIPDEESAKKIKILKKYTKMPIVADIHFNPKLAILSIENEADKIRINPGNIGTKEKLRPLISLALDRNIPIRLGFNSGSFKFKNHLNISQQLVDGALDWIKFFEDNNFTNIVISLKTSTVESTINAYRLISNFVCYPLHIGLTEAGPGIHGIIKSTVAISTLLRKGIGDTIRVSLTAPPEEEVKVAYEILYSLNLMERKIEIVSCPTCGRCEINLIKLVNEFMEKSKNIQILKKPIKVAIMGCIVNGPGEAKDADIGIAGAKGKGLLFKLGKPIKKIEEKELVDTLINEIQKYE